MLLTETEPKAVIPDLGQIGNELLGRQEVHLSFDIPRGKISQIMGILHLLQARFESMHLTVTAKKGSISEDDYVNKIKESLQQIGVDVE